MQFQRIKVKAAARLHAPLCICHWLKSNPICCTYVTVPAFTIVVKVHLTLSAVIKTKRARGGLTAVSANRHHGHFVKCKCFFFLPVLSMLLYLVTPAAMMAVQTFIHIFSTEWGRKFSWVISQTQASLPRYRQAAREKASFLFSPGFNYVTDLCGKNKKITMVRMYEIELECDALFV